MTKEQLERITKLANATNQDVNELIQEVENHIFKTDFAIQNLEDEAYGWKTLIIKSLEEFNGNKKYCSKVQVGKWFRFDINQGGMEGFGKVIEIVDENCVRVEKYFELKTYRPYAAKKWFDNLNYGVC